MPYLSIKGRISHLGDVESKTTRNGNTWLKQLVVILIPGPHNTYHEIAFTAQGNTVGTIEPYSVGDEVEVSGYISAREYNGRYYNDVSLSSIVPAEGTKIPEPEKPKGKDDLPF